VNWKCGIVQGIGFCAFEVLAEADTLIVRHIAIPQPIQDRSSGRGGVAWSQWWPEMMEYVPDQVEIRREHVFAYAAATEKAIEHAERAWGMRRIDTPEQGIVLPGGNGQ